MIDSKELYSQYENTITRAADLQGAAALLEWDQEVYMPAKSSLRRGGQLATLASQAHELLTSKEYGNTLKALVGRADLTDVQLRNVQLSLEDFTKNEKLPNAFIEEITRQTSASYSAWIKAREQNDYSIYAPELEKMIVLKKQQAAYYGYEKHPYDALLDDYEKGASVAMLDPLFAMVKKDLPVVLQKIQQREQVSNDVLHQYFPKDRQWAFSLEVLKAMGYDFEAGRQDISEHPFTTSFSATDVRVTTRVDENNFASLLWSSIHEGGHALYEQGLPDGQYGKPLGAAASLSIHESQSRLWENSVGRGEDFWMHFYPVLQQFFPEQLKEVSLRAFYKSMNQVKPSLIRTEADELTYHFHVLIRYEIEKGLIGGSLDPKDLREIWNDNYEKYLGIMPESDKEGILQDVHWSHGSFGYFPTYTLGSFYASQFFDQAMREIPSLENEIARGDFKQLLSWLREHVHQYGRRYTSEELCEKITGKKLDVSHFMSHIERKYYDVYGMI